MKRILFVLLAAFAVFSLGCSSSKVKPRKDVAAETEEIFRQRWLAKRITDITAANPSIDPREARRQAVTEFSTQYARMTIAKRADPMGDGTLP